MSDQETTARIESDGTAEFAQLAPRRELPEHEVTVSMGFTVQPKQYESIRHDVSLKLKGKSDETPEQTYAKAMAWVQHKVEAKLTELAED